MTGWPGVTNRVTLTLAAILISALLTTVVWFASSAALDQGAVQREHHDRALDLPPGATVTMPAIHPATARASCRSLAETSRRVKAARPVDECDLRNLVEAEEEVAYLRLERDREGGWCWDELELCEAGILSERACRGDEMTRFEAVIDDLEACARAADDR